MSSLSVTKLTDRNVPAKVGAWFSARKECFEAGETHPTDFFLRTEGWNSSTKKFLLNLLE
jgi:hypothetical protein